MDLGFAIGWVGLAFGVCIPIPQLIKIYKTRGLQDVSLGTYTFLVLALICYTIHAIYIESIIFTITQSVNLTTNSIIFILLLRNRLRPQRLK